MTVNDATRKLVRERAKGSIQKARRLWMRGGWHPPEQDPRQGSEED